MHLDQKTMRKLAALIAFAVVLFVGLERFDRVSAILHRLLGLATPFLLGGCIAFILNVPMSFFESRLFGKHKSKLVRPASLLLSLVFVIGVFTVAVTLVAPEISQSLQRVGASIPGFLRQMQSWLLQLQESVPALEGALSDLALSVFRWENIDWEKVGQTALHFLSGTGDLLGSTFLVASSIIGVLVNLFVSLIFSLYLLLQKETLGRQIKKLLYAVLPTPKAEGFLSVCSLAQQTFAGFIAGQCTEAMILGCLFFISMTLLQFPYALLVGVLIAVTALIPVFGAFLGCCISALLILIQNPMQALWFLILFLIIQQIEGNLIYPHVVGNSVGLPSIWVLVAVTVGASAMGVVGMLICIPLFSVFYALLRTAVQKRLRKKGISSEKWGDPPHPPAGSQPPAP